MALITVPPIRGYTARWRILDHPPGYKNPEEFLPYAEVGKPEQRLISGLLPSTPIPTAEEDETTRCSVRRLYFKGCRSSVLCDSCVLYTWSYHLDRSGVIWWTAVFLAACLTQISFHYSINFWIYCDLKGSRVGSLSISLYFSSLWGMQLLRNVGLIRFQWLSLHVCFMALYCSEIVDAFEDG